jgi:hypothetical protein
MSYYGYKPQDAQLIRYFDAKCQIAEAIKSKWTPHDDVFNYINYDNCHIRARSHSVCDDCYKIELDITFGKIDSNIMRKCSISYILLNTRNKKIAEHVLRMSVVTKSRKYVYDMRRCMKCECDDRRGELTAILAESVMPRGLDSLVARYIDWT